ncbi:hypothetical protein D3C78_1819940 [compost metagenome]
MLSDVSPVPSIIFGSKKLPGSIPIMAISTLSSFPVLFPLIADAMMVPIGDTALTFGISVNLAVNSLDNKDLLIEAFEPCSKTT